MAEQQQQALVFALIQRKDAMEAELDAIVSELNSGTFPVGLTGNLVDSDGFPRNDIDIMRITTQRNRYAVLTTDIKQILKEIETGLHRLHATAKPKLATDDKEARRAAALEALEPEFLRVNSVAFDSPAYSAGLREGDLIYRFGKLRHEDFASLQLQGVANEVVEGRPIRIYLRRGPEAKKITCTLNPRRWEGKGLLGCHLVPI